MEAAVSEAVTAWEDTCTNLKELCTKYHNAADLWRRYKEASDQVREWLDTSMESVDDLEPGEAIEAVKVSLFLFHPTKSVENLFLSLYEKFLRG